MRPSLVFFLLVGGTVWLALVRSVGAVDFLLGIITIISGWIISRRLAGPRIGDTPYKSGRAVLLTIEYLIIRVVPSVVRGTWEVIRYILSGKSRFIPALFPVELPGASPEALFLLSFGITLSPNRQVALVDEEKKIIYIHALHAPNQKALQTEVEEEFERYVKRALP